MASVNKVILIGNLGRDPEVRDFPNGGKIANVTIATTERWRDRNTGENRDATEWHRVVFNDRLADIASQYLRKGSPVYVEGSLRTRKWTDQNGQDRYSTEIRAWSMQLLGGRQDAPQQDGGYNNSGGEQHQGEGEYRAPPPPAATRRPPPPAPAPQADAGFADDMDDDIPF